MGNARSRPEQPLAGYPAIGAMHEVRLPNQALRDFISDFAVKADGIFEPVFIATHDILEIDNTIPGEEAKLRDNPDDESDNDIGIKETGLAEYDSKKYFTTFNVERMGLSVVEMQGSAKIARVRRAIWEKQDLGMVEQEARDEIRKHFPNTTPKLRFDAVANVGSKVCNQGTTDVRQKLALIPNAATYFETFELLTREHNIIINAIERRLKSELPYAADYVPHLTFAAFRNKAEPRHIEKIISKTAELVKAHPIEIRLGDLLFRRGIERRKRQ